MDEKEGMILSNGNSASEEEKRECAKIIDALAPVIYAYVSEGMKIFSDFWEDIKRVFNENPEMINLQQLQAEENRRIVHLMYNHKKERVCKKNIHRFMRIVKNHRKK